MYLVGDPVQLPATVISEHAVQAGYNTSLFKRLQAAGFPVSMLNIQVHSLLPVVSQSRRASSAACVHVHVTCAGNSARCSLPGLVASAKHTMVHLQMLGSCPSGLA